MTILSLNREPIGTRLVVADTTASIELPTTPTAFIWGIVTGADYQYNAATGVFTADNEIFFNSTAQWHVNRMSGNSEFYADAEFYINGVWVRGTNSGRRAQIKSTEGTKTIAFPFNGRFAAGTILRFVAWASDTGTNLVTDTINGSTFPASRLTINTIRGHLI